MTDPFTPVPSKLPRWTRCKILLLVLRARPMSVVIPAALIPIGAVATVVGPPVSRAFTLLPDSVGFIAHAMGMCMLMGGALVMLGVGSGETFTELIGLVLAALGCVTYGLGVIVGLGVNGLITGPMFIAIAAAAVLRVMFSLRRVAAVRANGS